MALISKNHPGNKQGTHAGLTSLKLFRFLILPYMLFLGMFLALIIFFYGVTFSVLYQETAKNSEAALSQGISALDSRLEEIDNVISRISISRNLQQLKNIADPFHESRIGLLIDAQSDIDSAGYANAYLTEYFLIYFDRNLVIGRDGVHTLERFTGGAIKLSGLPDLDTLQDKTYKNWLMPMCELTYKDKKRGTVLPYVHTMPNVRKNNVVLLMLISGEKVEELFDPFLSQNGSIMLYRPGSEILFEAGTERILPQNKKNVSPEDIPWDEGSLPYLHTVIDSGYKHYRGEALIPEQVVFGKVETLRNQLLALFSVLFLSGVVLAAVIAIKRTRALSPVLTETFRKDPREEGDVFQRIGQRINGISEDRNRQTALLRESFISNLVSGSLNEEEEGLRHILDSLDLTLSGDFYYVIVLRYTNPQLRGDEEMTLEDEIPLLAQYLENSLGLPSLSLADTFRAVIIQPGKGVPAQAEAECQRALQEYGSTSVFTLLSIKIGIGQSCTRLSDLPQSYREAQRVIDTRSLHEEITTLSYRLLKPDNNSFSYPLAVEQNLINLTLSCHREEAVALFDSLVEQNDPSGLSPNRGQLLLSLRGTLLRIADMAFPGDDGKKEMFTKKLLKSDMGETPGVTGLRVILEELLETLARNKVSKSEKLIGRIREYIDRHYTEADFGVPRISEQFSISEFHFSREFKKVTGTGFNTYLEDLRLDKAKEHLKEGTMSIKQISYSCGYNSSNTFCRAFKRRNGITPGDYKISRG